MIKDVAETAIGTEMTGFLGYDRYQTPARDAGNRRNGYSQKELASTVGPIVIDVPPPGPKIRVRAGPRQDPAAR